METQALKPLSKDPASGPYPEQDASSQLITLFR